MVAKDEREKHPPWRNQIRGLRPMTYATAGDYHNIYFGNLIPDGDLLRWLSRASDELNRVTYGRLRRGVKKLHNESVIKATCATADVLYSIDSQIKAMQTTVDSEGNSFGAVSSRSSGSESISYRAATEGAYAVAATDEAVRSALIYETAARYLSGVPDKKGVNLLYAGIV